MVDLKGSLHPFCSTEINFCTIEEMKGRLLYLSAKNVLLVMSQSSVTRWSLQPFIDKMENAYMLTRITQVAANPTQNDICVALKLLEKNGEITCPDCIIAIGGGSCIDLAKGLALFSRYRKVLSQAEITARIKDKGYQNDGEDLPFPPIIAIPATAGTGSEVTQWATIWDAEKKGKLSIDAPGLKPRIAMIVPELTVTLLPMLILSTGLDALSHAVEAYWSKYTTLFVQDIAYRAIELIVKNLKATVQSAIQNSPSLELHTKLCRASLLAGLAFSQTRTTACHSISYPMTISYQVLHGLAAAMTLGAVGEKNRGFFPHDRELFELFAPWGGLQNWLDDVSEGIVKLRLSSFGISKENIPFLANHSITSGRMDNNPVVLTEEDISTILEQLL